MCVDGDDVPADVPLNLRIRKSPLTKNQKFSFVDLTFSVQKPYVYVFSYFKDSSYFIPW